MKTIKELFHPNMVYLTMAEWDLLFKFERLNNKLISAYLQTDETKEDDSQYRDQYRSNDELLENIISYFTPDKLKRLGEVRELIADDVKQAITKSVELLEIYDAI